MSNGARKARKRAGVKFERKEKVPTGYLGQRSYDLPILPPGVLDLSRAAAQMWESRSFR